MGIFQTIRDAILPNRDGDDGERSRTAPHTGPRSAPAPAPVQRPMQRPAADTGATPRTAAARPAPIDEVDVEQRLDSMPGSDGLNWRSSIVDLMKLIGVDSSFNNRKQLAGELGDNDYSGSAEENVWLHKRTMQELAKHGGKVPKSFVD